MKKSLFTAFAVGLGLTVNVIAQVPSYVPTNGLVGWWPFNGNANDESGNGNNGTVNGATLTADRFGNANSSFDFDGLNDFIDLGSSSSLNSVQFNYTISYWINKSDLDNGMVIAACAEVLTGSGWRYHSAIRGDSTDSRFLRSDNLNWAVNFTEQGSISLNNWINICIARDGVKLSTYINGEFSSNSLVPNVSVNNTFQVELATTKIGVNWPSAPGLEYFGGKIDDIGIWNRALSDCEIADLYNAQLGSFSNSSVSVNPTSSAIGSNVTLSVSTALQNIQWQSNPSNIGWVNLSDNSNYNGVNNDTLVVSNLQLSNHNQPFRVLACGDTSNIATIQIADTCITNVTVYDALLTTVTDTLIINTTLSLPAPNNENTILIYPNPASDHITIDNGNFAAMAGYSIKIENNAGQEVFQNVINQQQFYVDLSTWTGNGLYFVHLIDPQNNTVTVRKIVLQ